MVSTSIERLSSEYSQRSKTSSDASSKSSSIRRRSRIGRYRRGKKVGEGGCAEVYEGINLLTGGFVAIKEMRSVVAESVCEELNLLKVLSHDNIVRLFDYTFHGPTKELTLYLELIEGGSLKDIKKQFRMVPTLLLSSYTHQILQGLSYLHSCNVMHLDLKPANILVSASGVVKIVDFGTSSIAYNSTTDASIPYKGTLLYSAPEAIRGHPVLKSDIWSLGITLLELSNGVNPWSDDDVVVDDNAMALAMRIGQLRRIPDGFCDTKSEVLSSFVEQCVRICPEERSSCTVLLTHEFINTTGSVLYNSAEASKFYDGGAGGSLEAVCSEMSHSNYSSLSSDHESIVTGVFVVAHHYAKEEFITYQSPFNKNQTVPTEVETCVKGTRDGHVCVRGDADTPETFRFDVFLDCDTTAGEVYSRVWDPALRTFLSGAVRHVAVVHSSMTECNEMDIMVEGGLEKFLNEVFRGGGLVRGACYTATQEKPSLFDVFNKIAVPWPARPATWRVIESPEHYLQLVNFNQLLFLGIDSPIQFCLHHNTTTFTFTAIYGHQWGYFSSGLSDVLTSPQFSPTMTVFGRTQVRHPLYRLISEAATDTDSFTYIMQTFRIDSTKDTDLDFIEATSCLRSLERAVQS